MSETRLFFDEYAHNFDELYGVPKNAFNRIINPIFRKSMRLRFEKTLKSVAPVHGKTIFDVGCGPGHYAIALAKDGAKKIVGVDFAPAMIDIAGQRAQNENVADRCEFIVADILEYQASQKFDFSILMGFMDYIADPLTLIRKVLALTEHKILFSFPEAGGLLAAQRKWRYRKRCPLYMYKENDLIELFSNFTPLEYKIEKISRDFFVTMYLK